MLATAATTATSSLDWIDDQQLIASHYIPSCAKSFSCGSGAELLSPDRSRFDAGAGAGRFLFCVDVSDLNRRLVATFSRSSGTEACEWRYLVLGQACFHLGLMEDAVVLLQTGRRVTTAAFRRESMCLSEEPSNLLTANNKRTSSSNKSSSSATTTSEAESVSQLPLQEMCQYMTD